MRFLIALGLIGFAAYTAKVGATFSEDIHGVFQSSTGRYRHIQTSKGSYLLEPKSGNLTRLFSDVPDIASVWLTANGRYAVGLVQLKGLPTTYWRQALLPLAEKTASEVLYTMKSNCIQDIVSNPMLSSGGHLIVVENCGGKVNLIDLNVETKQMQLVDSSSLIMLTQKWQRNNLDPNRVILSDRIYYTYALENPSRSELRYYDVKKQTIFSSQLGDNATGQVVDILVDHFAPTSNIVVVQRCQGTHDDSKVFYDVDNDTDGSILYTSGPDGIGCVYTSDFLTVIGDTYYTANYTGLLAGKITMHAHNIKTGFSADFSSPFAKLVTSQDGTRALEFKDDGSSLIYDTAKNTKSKFLSPSPAPTDYRSHYAVVDIDEGFLLRVDQPQDRSFATILKFSADGTSTTLANWTGLDGTRSVECFYPEKNEIYCTYPLVGGGSELVRVQ